MTNGSYNYYAPDATRPMLCSVENGFVLFMDAERAQPIKALPGRFVRLVEAPTLAPVDHTKLVVLMEKGEVRDGN